MTTPGPQPTPPHPNGSTKAAQRLALFQKLTALPGPQFEQILFALDPPAGNVPPAQTAKADRVAALLEWATRIGPGLEAVDAVYNQVVPPPPTTHHPTTPDRFWQVPYPRNPFFTGRDTLLADIHQALTTHHRAAFSGLGGLGKTQTAIEYAYRHRDEYQQVFWVRGETLEELLADYSHLAGVLQLPGADQPDQATVATLLKQWLDDAQHQQWLLIVDNADEVATVRPYLPLQGQGHLLLTTRAQALGEVAKKLELHTMTLDEGATFLLRRANRIDPQAELTQATAADQALARQLVAEMDGLPLALDQAGAYLEEQFLSLPGYLELYQIERAALLKERGELAGDHPSVTVTFTLAQAKVLATSPAAAALVTVCAFLAPDAIPETIFTEGATELGDTLSPLGNSPLALTKAIAAAAKFSLISRNPEAKTLTIHRLVQEVLRAEMAPAAQAQWAERVVKAMNAAFPDVQFQDWEQCDRLLPHAQVVIPLIDRYDCASSAAARLLNQTAYCLEERGRYDEAEPLFQRALAIWEQQLGPDHPHTATSLHHLALLYQSMGRYGAAEPLYQRALAIYEQHLGPDHPRTTASLNNLAVLYKSMGRTEAAEPLYQRTLAIQEQQFGPNHPDTATSLNNLAEFYRVMVRYGEAEPLHQRALAIREQQLGPDHPDTAQSLNNLGLLYSSMGRYDEAAPLFQRALAISEQQLGPDHPDTANSLNNLAVFYAYQGLYHQAEPLLVRALEIRLQRLGPDHPNTQSTQKSLEILRSWMQTP